MSLVLDGDTIEESRAFAEEERRRKAEEDARLAAIITEQAANAAPGVGIDPNSPTGWSYYGTPVAPDYKPETRYWGSPESTAALPDIGWNTPGSGNASVDTLFNTPAPAPNEGGTGFAGQNWYADPNYTPITPYEPPPQIGVNPRHAHDAGWYNAAGDFVPDSAPSHPFGIGAETNIGADTRSWWGKAQDAVTGAPGAVWDWQNRVNERLAANEPQSFAEAVLPGRGAANYNSLTGKSTSDLPFGVKQLAETAFDPATIAPFGLAGRGPKIIQSVAGPILDAGASPFRRVGTELAVNAAGMAGGEKASEIAAKYTDNPLLVGGAGLAGGLLAGGAVLAAPAAIRAGAKGAKVVGSELTTGRLASETGSLTLPPPAVVGSIGHEAARMAGHAAVGGGIGASVGAVTGEGDPNAIIKGALIGAGSGVALRGTAVLAGKVASRGVAEEVAKRAAKAGVPEPPAAVTKLTELINAAKPSRKVTEAMQHEGRQRQAALMLARRDANLAAGVAPMEGVRPAVGPLGAAAHVAPEVGMTPQDILDLRMHIHNNPRVTGTNRNMVFPEFNTDNALTVVLSGGVPTPGEVKLLKTAFGEEFAKAVAGNRTLGQKALAEILDVVNLPRSLITAFDASAPLRQGALLAAGHPIASARATGSMIRAMASPEYAKAFADSLELSPNAHLYDRMKLWFSDAAGPIAGREEAMSSKIAGKIPGVAGSQRGYTTYLNAVRKNIADGWLQTLTPQQLNDEKLLQDMGKILNVLSGRGSLGQGKWDTVLSASSGLFFAPRYAISRIQVPVLALQAVNPMSGMSALARKEVARDLVTFAATGTAILALGQKAGAWDVELDPRSTDFGKARIGATRWDMWGGEQQLVRTIAQFATQQRKSTSTGELIDTKQSDVLLRWFRSKVSPVAGLAWDVKEGKTFIGEELSADKSTLSSQSFQRLMPLFIQDVAEAWMEDGWKAGLRSLPSGAGMGVQTYLSIRDIQNRVAQEKFGKVYLDLNVGDQRAVKEDPRVQGITANYAKSVDANPDAFFARKNEVYKGLEEDFAAKIDQGLNPPALRQEVSKLKGERWTVYDALLGGDSIQKILKSGPQSSKPEDVFADMYWSAPVKETVENGEVRLDFSERDAIRARVLQEAQAAGINPEYITGRGKIAGTDQNTYLANRFTDPKVADAVANVEGAQKAIEDSGYWDLKDNAFETAKRQGAFKDAYVVPTTGMDYYDWIDAMVAKATPEYVKQGNNPTVATTMARADIMNNYSLVGDFNDWERTNYRDQWIAQHKQEALLLMKWGYVDSFGKDINAWLGKP